MIPQGKGNSHMTAQDRLAQLAAIQNFRTRYEIAAWHADGRRLPEIAFAARLSRSGLLAAMRNRGDWLVETLAIGEHDQITFGTKPRPHATLGNGWTVGFTGRTQRECITATP
jgi:predicted transcriptional regulator of viral defense system